MDVRTNLTIIMTNSVDLVQKEKNSGSVTLTPKAKEDPSNIYTTNIQDI